MTIKFPDVSHYNAPLSVAGAPVVIAKSTQGTSYVDPTYATFKASSSTVGAVFMAYHWVDSSDLSAQAKHAFSVAGSTPMMWDAEAAGSTVARLVSLTQMYRALGGVVHMVYLPHWWWQDHIGAPSLVPLAQVGLNLVSSNYTTYSDTGPGWAPYGGMAPAQWQYSDNQLFNGKQVDFNAYKGTAADYKKLISGGSVALTQADVDAVVAGVFAHVINAVSLGYSQPFSEYVKFAKGNSNDIGALNAKLDQVLALLAAGGGNGVSPAEVQQIVDSTLGASKIVPPAA